MPAPDLHRSLGSASSALSRWQAPPLPVRVPQFCSALCLSPKTQACNHPQPSQRAQTAVQVRWSTARPPCVMYQYLPSSWHPDAVQLKMWVLLIRISAGLRRYILSPSAFSLLQTPPDTKPDRPTKVLPVILPLLLQQPAR